MIAALIIIAAAIAAASFLQLNRGGYFTDTMNAVPPTNTEPDPDPIWMNRSTK